MNPLAASAPVAQAAPEKSDSVRDLILSVVAYGCLYWFVGSVVWLTFAVVDYLAPDPLAQTYNYYGDLVTYVVSPDLLASTLVSAIAAILLMRLARRAHAVDSDAKAARVLSRVLLYGSLAVVFVVLASDLVYALRGFFAADLPMNAALKAVSVAAYSLLAGWYLLALRSGFAADGAAVRGKTVGAIAAVVTLALIVTGGIANNRDGASLRDLRLDARRVQDLQQIQSSVISHWDAENGGPASLAVLEKEFGLTLPRDPETGAEYGYAFASTPSAGARDSFRLCATFAASSTETVAGYDSYGYYPMTTSVYDKRGAAYNVSLPEYGWSHGVGEVCFDRTPVIQPVPTPTY